MTVGSTGDSGGCSLRSVIEAVEAGTSGACGTVEGGTTTINVPANTITLSKQLVVKKGNMAIVGDEANPAGTVIKGGTERVLEIAGGTVELAGVEITKGHTPDGGFAPSLYTENLVGNGGGILNKSSLTLDHVIVTENHTGQGDLGMNGPIESSGGSGGRGGSGGGIFNEPGASLTIRESTISKNLTGNGGRGGEGGEGINAIGHFPNGGDGGHGGGSGDGGGIYNAGSLIVEGSTISGNFTGRGGEGGTGAIGTGPATVGESELSPGKGGDGGDGGNNGKAYDKNSGYMSEALKGGGGIYNAGSLTMVSSTISGNGTGAGGVGGGSGAGGGPNKYGHFSDSGRAGTGGGGGRGGGLFTGAGYGGHSPVYLTNVTIFGNRSGDGGTGGAGGGGAESSLGGGVGGWGGDGGGIWTEGATSGSEVVLNHLTIAGNGLGAPGLTGASPIQGGGCCGERGHGAGIDTGGRYDNGSAVYIKNSIVADNGSNIEGDANCYQTYYPTYVDITDQGGNVTWNDTTCPGKVADPNLGPLADNGGPTLTLLPGAGSAIEAVAAANCAAEDQRGFQRPGAGKTNCDAGAVETDLHGGGGGEESPKEEQPGGGNPGGTNPGGGNPGGGSPTTPQKPLKCKKGFKKKTVKGKAHCVKIKKKKHRHH